MNIINENVTHKAWGKGRIIALQEGKIEVLFEGATKMFVYPDAFEKFLTLENSELHENALEEISKKKEAKQEVIQHKRLVQRTQIRKKQKSSSVKGNIAIKSTYCDGGRTDNIIGFSGVCSEENIIRNIEANRIWCNRSQCADFYDEEISYEELLDSFSPDKYVCYESIMLSNMSVGAGYNHTGEKAGTPRYFRQVRNNGLLVLTTRLPNTPESERLIYAISVIDDYYQGDSNSEGRINGSDFYSINLSLEEAQKVKFWDFYFNQTNPSNIQFGTGLFRYLTNEQSLQIIDKFNEIKPLGSGQCKVTELKDHFLKVNNLETLEVGQLEGALMRK